MILAAEKDRKDAGGLFGLVHVKPVDGPVDRQMSQTQQQIVLMVTAKRRRIQPVGFLPDILDAVLAIVQRSLHVFAEASVAFKREIEDQGKMTLGFCRELYSEPHERGASQ